MKSTEYRRRKKFPKFNFCVSQWIAKRLIKEHSYKQEEVECDTIT
jgi:hypothetical protein